MGDRIKIADYQRRPVEEMEFPDGEVWRLRQPLEEDYYRRQQTVEEHIARVQERAKEVTERAKAKREQAERESVFCSPGQAPNPDDEARALIDEEADEETLPLKYTLRYMQASVLAIFVEPEQTPEGILEKLPPDLMHYLLARLDEVLTGDAAKKRVRESPAR